MSTPLRLSALNLDPRVRGYHSGQINASANGTTQLKTRVDLDSLFSQVDPGIVDQVTIIDGPYTSLYGPGFAFLAAELLPTPQFGEPQTHFATSFYYGTNGQNLYNRDNVLSSGRDWGVLFSYGIRAVERLHARRRRAARPLKLSKVGRPAGLKLQSRRLLAAGIPVVADRHQQPGTAGRRLRHPQFGKRPVQPALRRAGGPAGAAAARAPVVVEPDDYRGDALNFGKQWTFIQPFYASLDDQPHGRQHGRARAISARWACEDCGPSAIGTTCSGPSAPTGGATSNATKNAITAPAASQQPPA